ncbi:MAG: DUF2948 family protein [Hyphomicrobiaceae bacterium]|nr:DUF2948 family protein [Hyphomicrobiaceae bacterium]
MSDSVPLKLLALDAEDLAVLSAHLQDAVVRVGDLGYFPREHRFAGVLNRFDWLGALLQGAPDAANERRRAGLRFEQVRRARLQNLDPAAKDRVLSLLAITFVPEGGEGPGGVVHLHFSGDTAIELHVACVEAELKDLGAAWHARHRPAHPLDAGEPEPEA